MLITCFDNEASIDYMLDQAREAGASEAIVLTQGKAVAYKEFRRKTK